MGRGQTDPYGVWDPGKLRLARVRAGLTQEQLAAELGVTRISLGRWESGSPPRVDKRAAIEAWVAKYQSRDVATDSHMPEIIGRIDALQSRVRGLTRALIDVSDELDKLRDVAATTMRL